MSYRQIFDEAIGQTPPTWVDVDRVIRRERRVATVRRTLTAGAAVLVVATGTGTAIQLTEAEDETVPRPSDQLAGFPEYVDGTRVFMAASAPVADRTLSLTFTLTRPDLVLHSMCEPADVGGMLYAEVSVSDWSEEWLYCPALGLSGNSASGVDSWAVGVAVGEPVTATVRLTRFEPSSGGPPEPVPTEGTFGLAVGEPVPFEEYQFPPRPEALEPLPEEGPDFVVVRADPVDPNRRVETTIIWHADLYGCGGPAAYPFNLSAQTPGSLRVLVNGVEVARHDFWEYGLQGVGYVSDVLCSEVADGEEVTLAVEPEHMTGDWRVSLWRPER